MRPSIFSSLSLKCLTEVFGGLYITPILIFLLEPNLFLSISINTLSNKFSLF